MIASFRDRQSQRLANDEDVPKFRGIERAARLKLTLLAAAATLEDLRSPPGNRLEQLRGDRAGQYSLRINRRWRICFRWHDVAAYDVEVVDYH